MTLLMIIFLVVGFMIMKAGFRLALFGSYGIMKVGVFLFMLAVGWFVGGLLGM